MALDTTPGGSSSNAYLTEAEADAYFATRLHASVWTGADSATHEAAIQWATRMLDQQLEWEGYLPNEEQALRWPRTGVYTPDGVYVDQETIPEFLKIATAELAMLLISQDRTVESDTQGFASISVGPISLTVDKHDRLLAIPEGVFSIVRPYGRRRVSSSVKLRRA